jgi:hypothetical protein
MQRTQRRRGRDHGGLGLGSLCVPLCGLCFLCALVLPVRAQMDFKAASGIPRPVDDLPTGTVSVRVIRGDISNIVTNHPVEFHVGDEVKTVNTDSEGRAEAVFNGRATVQAVTTVDGERLESQTFPAPARGGIRLLLVAADKESAAREAEALKNAVTGDIVFGQNTEIVIEPDDERIRVYYLLEVVNNASAAVNPKSPVMFDVPSEAGAASIMEGTKAKATGTRVRIEPPFPPGATRVQVAYALPAASGSASISQVFPAPLEHLAIIVKKVGDIRLESPLVSRQQEMPANGDTYIAAAGDRQIPAGQPVTLTVSGVPHHSSMPRWIALGTAAGVIVVGVLALRRPDEDDKSGDDRKRLIGRREKLFQELVRLEQDRRRGRIDGQRYAARREDLIASLEQVYGALDDDAGLAA